MPGNTAFDLKFEEIQKKEKECFRTVIIAIFRNAKKKIHVYLLQHYSRFFPQSFTLYKQTKMNAKEKMNCKR